MTFFDNVRERLKDAAKTAVKTSNEIMEISKLNIILINEKEKIKAHKLKMGEMIYEACKSGEPVDDELAAICSEIETSEKNIDDLRRKIRDERIIKPDF